MKKPGNPRLTPEQEQTKADIELAFGISPALEPATFANDDNLLADLRWLADHPDQPFRLRPASLSETETLGLLPGTVVRTVRRPDDSAKDTRTFFEPRPRIRFTP